MDPVLLEREAELAVLSAAATAATAGHGALVLVEGPAGIGKTTLLRAACGRCDGLRVLTARGLSLERGFPYGIVRQLLDPVRGEDGLLDGAAGLAARVFDWIEAGPVEDDIPYATMHGLYWLVANLAARQPLILAVDDAHWADAPSLRWLAHLAARLDGLPAAVFLAVRDGPDAAALLDELRASPGVTRLALGPLGPGATAELVRRRLGGRADADLCRACHDSTGGNPFLLEALATALRDDGRGAARASSIQTAPGPSPQTGPGSSGHTALGLAPRASLGLVAEAVLRRVAQLGDGAGPLTRALAVLGGPSPLRHAAALAGLDLAGLDLAGAARLADRLRAADVLAPGSTLEFAHPIVRTAVYEAIPPGERALAHAEAAVLLERDGAGPERLALHLLHSEPAGDARVAGLLRAAATAASGRGAPAAAADYLRRALDEPPAPAERPDLLLELGIALARERHPEAVTVLHEAARLAPTPAGRAAAALAAARVLGIWGYHDGVIAICRDALAGDLDRPVLDSPVLDSPVLDGPVLDGPVLDGPVPDGPGLDGAVLDDVVAASLEAELFQSSFCGPATAASGAARAIPWLADPSSAWRVNDALVATVTGQPVKDLELDGISPDSLTAVYALLVLIWNDDLGRAGRICDAALADARRRGSRSMVAHASCLRSMIMRRLGRLEEAAADARLALDFKLATSPPLAVAWAAGFGVDALTCLGRLDEADAMAAVAAGREPPDGWIHAVMFRQARGALRVAQHRPAEALEDLLAAAGGWRGLGVTNPAVASWRTAAVAAHRALGQPDEAAALAREQLALARAGTGPITLGVALRASAMAQDPAQAVRRGQGATGGPPGDLAEAVRVLEATPARYDLAVTLADYGASLRRCGQRTQAREPLLRALDLAERTGAATLAAAVRQELLAVGARPRRTALTGPDALTSTERRVAALAADGLSNRQIAEHLFVTQATVETHLRHAFRKLGITSRTDLPGLDIAR